MKKILIKWFIMSLVGLVLIYIFFPEDLISFADIFNKFAIGIAAILGVIFGSSYINEQIDRRENIQHYLKKYPDSKYGKTWEIVDSETKRGAWYLLDKNLQKKHHIVNWTTIYDLGWHIYEFKSIKHGDFMSYEVGDRIRTHGNIGE